MYKNHTIAQESKTINNLLEREIYTNGQVIYSEILAARLIIIFLFVLLSTALLAGRFSELFLPNLVGGFLVQAGEKDVKYLRVPAYWVAFDALFDVL